MNNILHYRIAYLKAITLAWQNPEFKTELLGQDNVLAFLENNSELFNNYRNPFQKLTISVSETNTMGWNPTETLGWVGPNDFIKIALPNKPQATEIEEDGNIDATALADYYALFPDFLGPLNTSLDAIINGVNESNRNSPEHFVGGPLPTKLGIGDDEITDFGAVMLRVIALSWINSSFKEELIAASTPTDEKPIADSSPVIAKYLGYNNPWNFNLQFFESQEFNYEVSNYSLNTKNKICVKSGKWTNIPNNHIQLWFPNKPAVESQMPTALTAYNNNGPAYPFTCS